MGMFDYVRCEYPLPDGAPVDGYQTKDAECWPAMDSYTITAEGRLIHHVDRYEYVPEEERPMYGTPAWEHGGLARLCGMVRRVPVGDEEVPFHGALRFYQESSDGQWWNFVALFKRGELIELSGGREEDDDA